MQSHYWSLYGLEACPFLIIHYKWSIIKNLSPSDKLIVSASLRVMKIQVGSYHTWQGHDTPTYLKFAGYDCLGIQFFSCLDLSPWYCGEWSGIELAWEPKERMDMLENTYSYPVPWCKGPRYCKLGKSKTVCFPRQVAECLTKLPGNYSLAHFPFLYRDFPFAAFSVRTDPD